MLAQTLTRPTIARSGAGTAAETYEHLRAEATRLAGAPGDIAPRAAILHTLYLDSGGNHAFPEVALHGALWAHGALGLAAQASGLLIRARHRSDERKRAQCLRDLHAFVRGLKIVNRQVFIDTYVTYHFSRLCGDDPAAHLFLPPPLLAALTEAHATTRMGRTLAPDRRRELFALALRHEQERTVTRGVREVMADLRIPALQRLLVRPTVRFAYFPRGVYLFFRDFACQEERIMRAMQSYELAERCGWDRVGAAIGHYGLLPASFFRDPRGYAVTLAGERLGAPALSCA